MSAEPGLGYRCAQLVTVGHCSSSLLVARAGIADADNTVGEERGRAPLFFPARAPHPGGAAA